MTADRVITYQLRHVDLLRADVDVVALKYAQGFHGADRAVAFVLESAGISSELFKVPQWNHVIRPSQGAISADHVLFVGVPPLANFLYDEIRRFSAQVLTALSGALPEVRTVAMTLHGVGYGLDLVEAAAQQCLGVQDAIAAGNYPERLQSIVIVERLKYRIDEAAIAIDEVLGNGAEPVGWKPTASLEWPIYPVPAPSPIRTRNKKAIRRAAKEITGQPEAKRSVFVAMPFRGSGMRDAWRFGLHSPVREAGHTCNRMDEEYFTGDIVARMKKLIDEADLVIADLTGSNANVFLEAGYAWGRGRPTLFICRKTNGENPQLPFDVGNHRCLFYEDATELEELMKDSLDDLIG